MTQEMHWLDLEETLLPWLGRNSRLYANLVLTTFKENNLDLSREQMMILKQLAHEDGLVQNDLAFITNRDKTSLTRIVNNMEKKDLLYRKQCSNDNRCNRIYITKKGQEWFQKGLPIVKQVALKMQHNLSSEEIQASINVLKKVFNNLSIESNEEK